MKIHELAQKTDLTAPTIRFYEQAGLLDERHVCRAENNYRDYNQQAVDHLLLIKRVQASGFTLAEIKELIQAEATDELSHQKKVELICRKMREVEKKMAELAQIQTYLAQMLARRMAKEQRRVYLEARRHERNGLETGR